MGGGGGVVLNFLIYLSPSNIFWKLFFCLGDITEESQEVFGATGMNGIMRVIKII